MRTVCVVCIAAIAVSFALTHADVIAMFFAGRFAGIDITYSGREGTSFTSLRLSGLKVRLKGEDFSVSMDNANFWPRWDESINAKKIIVDCVFDGVRFYSEKGAGLPGDTPQTSSLNALARVPFQSEWEYRFVTFTGVMALDDISVRSFRSISDNILVSGSGKYRPRAGDFRADLHMAFAPELSKALLMDFGDMFLTPERSGWYGVSIRLSGNTRDRSFHMRTDRLEINIRPE